MSLAVSGGAYLQRTANLPSVTAFAITGWTVRASNAAWGALCTLEHAPGSAYCTLQMNDTSNNIECYANNVSAIACGSKATGVAYFFAMVCDGTGASGVRVYIRADGASALESYSGSGTNMTFTPSSLRFGTDQFAEHYDGRFYNVKVWDRAPTAAELLAESFWSRPVYETSLNFHWALWNSTDTTDRSGNGRDATVSGTPTTGGQSALWRPRTKVSFPFVTAAAGGATKVMTETITLTDEALDVVQRVRLLEDTATFADSVVKNVILGTGLFIKVMSDTITVADSIVQWLRRVRGPIDTVSISDGDTYRVSIITASESFETSDGFVSWRRLKRLAEDNLDLIDGFSKIISGAGITYARVMSDTVTLVDDAGQRWRLRVSQLTEAVGLSDEVIRYLRRIRQLGDDIEYSDGTVSIRRYGRQLDESIEVSDGLISTLYLDQMSNISFSFGSTAPPFRFGGQ